MCNLPACRIAILYNRFIQGVTACPKWQMGMGWEELKQAGESVRQSKSWGQR
jgi:hypothetical protein